MQKSSNLAGNHDISACVDYSKHKGSPSICIRNLTFYNKKINGSRTIMCIDKPPDKQYNASYRIFHYEHSRESDADRKPVECQSVILSIAEVGILCFQRSLQSSSFQFHLILHISDSVKSNSDL